MRLLETAKFQKLRSKLREDAEKDALRGAILALIEDPHDGKKLKGEFKELLSFRYSAQGQSRRLIYKLEKDMIVLFSFGPRQGIYK